MVEPVPSKDLVTRALKKLSVYPCESLLYAEQDALVGEIQRLREELAREVGTRAARVAEIDALRRQLNKAVVERAWALGAFERFQVGDEVT